MKFTDSLNVDTDFDDAAIQRNSKGAQQVKQGVVNAIHWIFKCPLLMLQFI